MANIDESKFGRLTADLLVRKGDAEPSDIRRARKRKNETPPLNVVTSNLPPVEPAPVDEPAPFETADVKMELIIN